MQTETDPPPRRVALYAVAFFLLCWAILAIGDAPFAILHDMAEPYAWGRQFELGYNQHPPFWAWICGAWFYVFPRAGWSFAALDALNAAIGLLGAWALIGDFARGERRVAAFALLLLTPIYTLGAYKYDANTIFISVWPWMTHAFVRALRTRTLSWSLGFGALVGVALLCKYYAVVPIAVCGLAALASPEGRRYLRSASPWISAATAALLFAPHAFWLVHAGAPPLRYFASASGLDWGVALRAAYGSALGVACWFILVAVVLVYFAWSGAGVARPQPRDRAEALTLAILALGPLTLTLACGLLLRVRQTPEMPVGVLALIPLLAIEAAGLDPARGLGRFARRAAVFAVVAMAALSPAVMLARTYSGDKADGAAPYAEAAEAVTRLWRERNSTPLPFVAGAEYTHYIVFYSSDRPQAFFQFSYDANLWITPEALARRGWAAVCAAEDAGCVSKAETFSDSRTERRSLIVSHRFLGHVARPRELVVFLAPPAPEP